MSHPVRIYILDLLNNQPYCYSSDLSDILPIAKSTLSQHLKELKDAGLIQGEIESPRIKYYINKKNREEARLLTCGFKVLHKKILGMKEMVPLVILIIPMAFVSRYLKIGNILFLLYWAPRWWHRLY